MIPNNCSHPRDVVGVCTGEVIDISATTRLDMVIGIPAVVMLGVTVDTLVNVDIIEEIIVLTVVGVPFDFIFEVNDGWAGAINGRTPNVGAEANVSGLSAAMTALDFAVLLPFGEASFSC